MIKFNTTRFGSLEVEDDKVIEFPKGLVGLPDLNKYILIDHKDTPVKWLQALDDPDIAFIVASPTIIMEDYSVELDDSVKQSLELQNEDDLVVLVIMRVDGEDVIANFHGPLIINARIKQGMQLVMDHSKRAFQRLG